MTHPDELLAGYVDGALSDDERAVIDAHLHGCAVCREEIELARGARAALAAIEEEPVPFGVTGPVLAEARRRSERGRAKLWGRVQWAAGLAAAAAFVLVVGLNLSNDEADRGALGVGGGEEVGVTAPDAATEAGPPPGGLERQIGVNYDDAGIQSLAQEVAQERKTTADLSAGEDDALSVTAPPRALRCLNRSGAFDEQTDELVRLIEAEYDHTPAFIAVLLRGPGAGQPADTVVVLAVAKDDCRTLVFASQSI